MSVVQRFGTLLGLTGHQQGHIAWWLASQVPWDDIDERDGDYHVGEFVRLMQAEPPAQSPQVVP